MGMKIWKTRAHFVYITVDGGWLMLELLITDKTKLIGIISVVGRKWEKG